jgi:translation initiation factor IF-1
MITGGYDIRIRGAVIKPGDRVLVKVVSFDGKHKLADRWEQDVFC